MNILFNKSKLNILFILSVLAFLTIILGMKLHMLLITFVDQSAFHWFLNSFGDPQMNYHGSWFNDYMTIVATYGDILPFVILTILMALIVFLKRHVILSIWLLLTVASGGLMGIMFKDLIHRARPYDHLSIDSGYSFPSGHSLASTLVIMIIVLFFISKIHNKLLKWSLTILLTMVWLSILFSRLYFHAHYLTDVMGSVTFSLSWGFGCIMLYQQFAMKLNQLRIFKKNKNYHVFN